MRSTSLLVRLLWCLPLVVGWCERVASAASVEESLRDIGVLQQAGKHAEAMEAADAALAALPAEQHFEAWRLPFNGFVVRNAWLGRRYGYFHIKGRGKEDVERHTKLPRPDLAEKLPALTADNDGYDWASFITCVDLRTGQRQWTRRLWGDWEYVIDQANDDLLAKRRNKVFRLSAKDGAAGEEPAWPEDKRLVREAAGVTHVLQQRQVMTVDTVETHTLLHSDKRLAWYFVVPGYARALPLWLGDDVLVLAGNMRERGSLHRLNGSDGSVRWSLALPHQTYEPKQQQLADGTYIENGSALGLFGDDLAVLGGDGALLLANPANGQLVTSWLGARAHLTVPAAVGELLVVASTGEIRAVRLAAVRDRSSATDLTLRVAKARSQLAAGVVAQAEATLRGVLQINPEDANAWDLLAQVGEAKADRLLESGAAVQAMVLRGNEESARLRERFGLIQRLNVGGITAPLVPVEGDLFVGTLRGELLKISPLTGRVLEQRQFDRSIRYFMLGRGEELRGPKKMELAGNRDTLHLIRTSDARERESVTTLRRAPDVAPDVLPGSGPTWSHMPREFQIVGGYYGAVHEHNGSWYRSTREGVLIYDGRTVREVKSPLGKIGRWEMAVFAGKRFGYGSGGVYALSDELCPERRIIDAGVEPMNRTPYDVVAMSSDGETIAITVWSREGPLVQVWSMDGKLLREVRRLAGEDPHHRDAFLPLNGGYLYSGTELLWISADDKKPLWRFGGNTTTRLRQTMPLDEPKRGTIGVPRLMGKRLYVGASAGGLYIFDSERIGR